MKTQIAIAISALAGLAVGGFVGYVVTERALRARNDEILDAEVARIKEYYKDRKSDVVVSVDNPRERIEEMSSAELFELGNRRLIGELHYASDEPEVVDHLPEPDAFEVRPEHEARKMTVEEATPIDYESDEYAELVESRTAEDPYIITVDEYMEPRDDPEWDQLSFTYFEGDDILADEREKPITEVNATIGEDHLTMFGKFSKDKNIVYVRNERIKTDFEITRDNQSFGEVVAGFKSHNPQMKMREGD